MSVTDFVLQLPASLASGIRAVVAKFTTSSSTPLLPFIPKPVKVLLLLLILLHSPSWPFLWHIRVWYHGIKAYYLVYRKGRSKYLEDWKKQNDRSGGIKGLRVRQKRVAWMDDCDYNMHLSNSAYAKNSDPLKMDWCIQALSPTFTPRSHMALGATHYNFFKEIPIGMEYTMEARCGGWDEKWMFVIIEFIIYPKKKSQKSKPAAAVSTARDKTAATVSENTTGLVPTISAPPSRSDTPTPAASTSASGVVTPSGAPASKVEEIKRAWAKKREEKPRADGGVVCCMTISEYCFKMGRVTVPPRVALWLSLQSPNKEEQDRARAIVMGKDGGKAFLRGGWKNEPNAETLGADIGLGGEQKEGSWVEEGPQGMEKVVEGMSVF
ncbi:hypothetical protein IAT38_003346 [Cryptococcus sp. DSM 104549]